MSQTSLCRHPARSARRQLLAVATAAFLVLQPALFAPPSAIAQRRPGVRPGLPIGPRISVTTLGTPITQNFDTLPASGSTTFVNDSTLPGWYHARTGTGTTIVANDGSSNAGNLYSYGTGTNTDRALGSLGSGNAAIGNLFWGIELTNNTGATITQLDVTYTGEQWRNSAAAAQTLTFSYLIGSPTVSGTLAEFQSAGVAVPQLDFTSPITGGAAGALNGNLAANRVTLTHSITGLNIPNGTEVMLRWSDPDHTGADHGLSIDDFSVTPQGAPDIFVRDARVAEPSPSPNSTNMVFTVALSAAPAQNVSVNFTTNDGTATAGADYTPSNGQVTFSAMTGERVKTISVPVLAENPMVPASVEGTDETFTVTLSGAVNANISGTGQATGTITTANPPGTLLISELRSSGSGGSDDDYVEIYNDSDQPLVVGSSGFLLVAANSGCSGQPTVVGQITNTTIPARGHFLFTGSGYSLAAYGASDATLVGNLSMDANVGLFEAADLISISSANRRDAVGFGINVGGICDLLREGSPPLGAANNSPTEHAFVRKFTLAGNNLPVPTDQNNNSTDFWVVSTTPSTAVGTNAAPVLGAPGPAGTAGPNLKTFTQVGAQVIDPAAPASSPPNRARDLTPVTNGANGTLSIRRTFTNNTGGNISRLRFRLYDITTFNSPNVHGGAAQADLRALSSGDTTVTVTGGGMVTAQGTTLETPPAQPNGGGLNSSMAAGTITMMNQLAPGASVNVQFVFGVQSNGKFRVFVFVEALP